VKVGIGLPGADAAWTAAGRAGRPRKVSQGYFALGPAAREIADGHAERRCDELILFPCSTDLDEVDRLLDVVGARLS
jgi:hypothetical protein